MLQKKLQIKLKDKTHIADKVDNASKGYLSGTIKTVGGKVLDTAKEIRINKHIADEAKKLFEKGEFSKEDLNEAATSVRDDFKEEMFAKYSSDIAQNPDAAPNKVVADKIAEVIVEKIQDLAKKEKELEQTKAEKEESRGDDGSREKSPF